MPNIRIASSIAKKSTHFHRHAAIVVKGGAILAVGYNHDGRHAEVVALSKLWPDKRIGTTVYSLRFNRQDELRLAYPCKNCAKFLTKNGVKSVMYSIGDSAVLAKMFLL